MYSIRHFRGAILLANWLIHKAVTQNLKNENKIKLSKFILGQPLVNQALSFLTNFFLSAPLPICKNAVYLRRLSIKRPTMKKSDTILTDLPTNLADTKELPTVDELQAILGCDPEAADAYLSPAQLEADREAAVYKAGLRSASKRVASRLKSERKRLDEQVRMMAATDPRSREANPYLYAPQNAALQRERADAEANVQALEQAQDALRLSTSSLIRSEMENQQLSQRAATLAQEDLRPEVARLLASLNINLDLSLNGRQTANLMSALLTCNENQIQAVLNNPKVPIAVKLMAKRLQDDLKAGSTTALESLWDRIFGKGILDINGQAAEYKRSTMAKASSSTPASQTVVQIGTRSDMPRSNGRQIKGEEANRLLHDAALPEQPLSREAYVLIREHFAPYDPSQPSQQSHYEPQTVEEAEYVDEQEANGQDAAADSELEGLL